MPSVLRDENPDVEITPEGAVARNWLTFRKENRDLIAALESSASRRYQMIKKFTVFCDKYSYSEVEDYTNIVNDWISNGANGTKEDVLHYMRNGEFDEDDDATCAYGWLEALGQSDHAPHFLWIDDLKLKVKVEDGKSNILGSSSNK